MRPLLGTYVELGGRGAASSDGVEAALRCIEEAHARWSFHSPDSELSRLNANPGRHVPMARASLRLLRLSRAMMKASRGAFDFTVGGTLVEQGVLPHHGGTAPLPRGTADDIEIGATWACLRRPVRLTLDGIAKGYAVDLALAAMRARGLDGGWINAGGDIGVFGNVTVAVQRRELDGTLKQLGRLREAAIATSRVPASSAPADDDFPGRIIGLSAPDSGVWTVLAHTAWRADALTKVAANSASTVRAEAVSRLGGHLVEAGAPRSCR